MKKQFFLIFLFFVFFFSYTFATITVSDINLSCGTKPSDANCLKTANFVVDFKVTDNNAVDGGAYDWNYAICYIGTGGSASCQTLGNTGDLNLIASSGYLQTKCSADILSDSNNFTLGRNCQASWTWATAGKSAGTYDMNFSVWDINGHFVNSGGSKNISFTLGSPSVTIDQTVVSSTINNSLQLGETTMSGIQTQGTGIGSAIGLTITVMLWFAVLFTIVLTVTKLLDKLKGINRP